MTRRMVLAGSVLKGIVSGKSVKTLERPPVGNEFGILKVSAVTWGEFRPYESKAMPSDYEPGDCPRAMDGDILISRANTRELVGAPVMVRGDHPRLLLSDKLLKLVADEAVVDRRYLVRALRSSAAVSHFSQRAGGSSGSMKNVTQSDIREVPIPLPTLTEQRRIAAILDQAEALRTQRRVALDLLDTLAQSVFVEMFGDPVTNPFQISTLKGHQACTRITVGIVVQPSAYYRAQGVPALRTLNIRTNRIVTENLVYFSAEDNEGRLAKTRVRAGDVLVVRTGQPGTAAVVPEELDGVNAIDLLIATPNRAKVLPDFLCFFLNSDAGRRLVLGAQRGQVQKHLNVGALSAAEILIPSLRRQETFAAAIKAIESLKAKHRASLAHLDALFASLQHRAFHGEL